MGKRAWTIGMYVYATLSGAWILYLLYLDFRFQLFPAVLVGGAKILVAGTGLLFALLLLVKGTGRIVRSIRHRSKRYSSIG